jgi:nucleotide-binding universal stress UspA family protein
VSHLASALAKLSTFLSTTKAVTASLSACWKAAGAASPWTQFDANLTLLHVLEEPYTSDTELEPGAEELPVLKKSNEERALALLEEELRSEYRNCRSCFRVGNPFRQIVHEAENIKASVIVISSHSYRWLERVLHGSGAEMILHSTLCPVLVVKEPGTVQGSEPQETP